MNRSTFLGSTAIGATTLATPPGGFPFVERHADFDEAAFTKIVGRPADYHLLWEAVALAPSFLNNVKNAINGLQFGFDADPAQIVSVVAGHGPSSVYTYSDYVWQKYRIGEYFGIKDPATNDVMIANTFLKKRATSSATASSPDDPSGFFQDTAIETLQARGVTFLTCHTAVEEQARGLVSRGFAPAGTDPLSVAADILTHLIPGAIVVPSMVATIAVIQLRYRYAYLNVA
jgi:intracellular sulfur oxidation DsrE/DsrF family protein